MFYLLADRAKLLIVWEALRGARRFCEFKRNLRLSDGALSGRLSDLVTFGVLRRTRYKEHPPRSEYTLTEMGAGFWRVGMAVWEWQRIWGTDVDVPKLVHDGCAPMDSADFGCAACDRPGLNHHALRIEWLTPTEMPVPKSAETSFRYRKSSTRSERWANWGELSVVIGDRWALNLIAQALLGVTRFAEFERRLAVSPAQLSQRLSDLVDHQFLKRVPTTDGGSHQHYLLRRKSCDLIPVLLTNGAWVRRWFAASDGPQVSIWHETCGQELEPDWWCGVCHQRLSGGDVLLQR
jgi:DNA-binding HxlR family transcriptional regulator